MARKKWLIPYAGAQKPILNQNYSRQNLFLTATTSVYNPKTSYKEPPAVGKPF